MGLETWRSFVAKSIATHLNHEGEVEETGKTINLGKLWPSGQLSFCSMSIANRFWATISSQWFMCIFSFKTSGPLSPGQSLESAVPARNGAPSAHSAHIGMERRGRWNVCLRRLRRLRPQCQQLSCGGTCRSTPRLR